MTRLVPRSAGDERRTGGVRRPGGGSACRRPFRSGVRPPRPADAAVPRRASGWCHLTCRSPALKDQLFKTRIGLIGPTATNATRRGRAHRARRADPARLTPTPFRLRRCRVEPRRRAYGSRLFWVRRGLRELGVLDSRWHDGATVDRSPVSAFSRSSPRAPEPQRGLGRSTPRRSVLVRQAGTESTAMSLRRHHMRARSSGTDCMAVNPMPPSVTRMRPLRDWTRTS